MEFRKTARRLIGGAAVCAVLSLVFASGTLLEARSRADAIETALAPEVARASEAEQRVGALEKRLKMVEDRITGRKKANDALIRQVNLITDQLNLEQGYAGLTERYVHYLVDGSDESADQFARFVCKLYQRRRWTRANVTFLPHSLKSLLMEAAQLTPRALAASGYDPSLLVELARLAKERSFTASYPAIRRAVRRLARAAEEMPTNLSTADEIMDFVTAAMERDVGRPIREVSFPARPPVVIPPNIALRVHGDPDCRLI